MKKKSKTKQAKTCCDGPKCWKSKAYIEEWGAARIEIDVFFGSTGDSLLQVNDAVRLFERRVVENCESESPNQVVRSWNVSIYFLKKNGLKSIQAVFAPVLNFKVSTSGIISSGLDLFLEEAEDGQLLRC